MLTASLPEFMRVILAVLTFVHGGENINRHETLCLAQAVYFEARNQSLTTQMSIASFLHQFANRNETTICEEIYESRGVRYPWAFDKKNMNLNNYVEHKAWEQAVLISALTIQGHIKDDVGDATHFLMPEFIKQLPVWYDPKRVVSTFGVVEYLRLPDYK